MKTKKYHVHVSFDMTKRQYDFVRSRADYYGWSVGEYIEHLVISARNKLDDTDYSGLDWPIDNE
ncbi:MAG: hypothetical protein KIG42_05070 [Paludibacteraceae bacterium]|nr:hypothetical protein [Paludibacteraceae bacterium]